ncbi:hypothetical protein ACEWY4_021502 [Coilia grayii]|uniref:Swi5-dependent recombination DNA repair protein 1 homolog n=1 Tax=Coilia grayii TaxID=363190 RepID=A0ABD1J9K3_9TELE
MDTTPKAQKPLSVLHTPGNDVDANVGSFTPCERMTMSSSLRQRLKRSRRSFTSPLAVAKRLNVDTDEDSPASSTTDDSTILKTVAEQKEFDLNQNEKSSFEGSPRLRPHTDSTQSAELRDRLRREVKEKTETLRRLQMVKMYRKKNDLTQLRVLISKWRHCAQAVLYEMQTALPTDGHKACLGDLIDHFGLEDRLLHYDRTEDDFKEQNQT